MINNAPRTETYNSVARRTDNMARKYYHQCREIALAIADAIYSLNDIRCEMYGWEVADAEENREPPFSLLKQPELLRSWNAKQHYEGLILSVIEETLQRVIEMKKTRKRIRADDLFQPTLQVVKKPSKPVSTFSFWTHFFRIPDDKYTVEAWFNRNTPIWVGEFPDYYQAKYWVHFESSDFLQRNGVDKEDIVIIE